VQLCHLKDEEDVTNLFSCFNIESGEVEKSMKGIKETKVKAKDENIKEIIFCLIPTSFSTCDSYQDKVVCA
jgi:hypothetical protein